MIDAALFLLDGGESELAKALLRAELIDLAIDWPEIGMAVVESGNVEV